MPPHPPTPPPRPLNCLCPPSPSLVPPKYACAPPPPHLLRSPSPLNNEKRKGVFVCAGCGSPLFNSETKYNSGTGWPSFNQAIPGEAALLWGGGPGRYYALGLAALMH